MRWILQLHLVYLLVEEVGKIWRSVYVVCPHVLRYQKEKVERVGRFVVSLGLSV